MQKKFRIWNSIHKEMIYPGSSEVVISLEGVVMHETSYGMGDPESLQVWNAKKIIALQWSGFVDKNKKEIYEGDLSRGGMGQILLVVLEPGGFYDKSIQVNNEIGFLVAEGKEIIGNMYQNPELMPK